MASPDEAMRPRPLTHRDLDYTPEDGNRYEVIDGALHVTPFPTPKHQKAVGELFSLLHDHVRANHLGEVYPPGLKVVLDEPSGVGPDIVYISMARLDGLREDGYYGPPDLVVEVLSSKPQLDLVIKLQKYAQGGIPHYWIVDPVAHSLTAYELDVDQYRIATQCSSQAMFEPALFPGLSIPLAVMWQ